MKCLRPKKPGGNPLQPEDWETFYSRLLPPKTSYQSLYLNTTDSRLDATFTVEEIKAAIKRLKNGKSPGIDGVTNEALKSLPLSWTEFLSNFYNRILEVKRVPADWSTIEIAVILKKGDPADASNYGGIALISCIA